MATVTWTGISGWPYEFGVYDLAATFRPVPGVYILCRRAGSLLGNHLEALYIGETQSLEDRLNTCRFDHDGFKRASQMGLSVICARVVTDGTAERLRIETELRHAFNPPCNEQPVPANNPFARTTLRF